MDLIVYLFIVCANVFALYSFYGLLAYCKYNNYKNSSDVKIRKIFNSQMDFDDYCNSVYRPVFICELMEKRWSSFKSINHIRKHIKYMSFICSKISAKLQRMEEGA